jgi:hypothetical protein
VFDKVTIAYRGAGYEVGRGPDFYGVWTVGAPRSEPLERWPETQEGWSAAWGRFTAIEAPGTIAPASKRTSQPARLKVPAGLPATAAGVSTGAISAALLLAVGVALGVAGLFPAYLDGSSLASQPVNLVPHVIYLATWSASAVLILLGGTRPRMGALLATGTSIVTFGLFFADVGTAIAAGAHVAGLGLVLGLLGWLACAAGSVVALRIRPAGTSGRRVTLGKPRGSDAGPVAMLVLAGLGTAVAFAPAWDSFILRTASGQTQTVTAGNAFANPAPVIAGNVAVMIALAAVVVVAALWRPRRYGAALLAGAIIPMAAQAISALIQVGEPVSPAQFGISAAEASQLGLTITSGLTPAFWIYCVFVVALTVSCAWMFFTPQAPVSLSDRAGVGYGADADVDVWHVARADTFDVTDARPSASGDQSASDESDDDGDYLGDGDFDDDDFGRDELDTYQEFESDNPSDSAVTQESGTASAGSRGGPTDEAASRD